MLIKLDGEVESFYLCTSSDWTTIVLAENESEAASKALRFIYDSYGETSNIAFALRVKKINEGVEINDFLFKMDEILADIGQYKDAKALREIMKNIK